jgi:DNA-binding CsgD family transcriptional regulator
MLASGELDEARSAADELGAIAGSSGRPMLAALASYATGAVELAGGDAAGAMSTLGRSRALWQELDAPYEVARTQVLAALACRTLGDRDTAAVEPEAARECFRTLGAVSEAAKVDGLLEEPGDDTYGLTPRELEVLRLVAGGKTNREIASILVVSEHTVARHVQNILLKLRVSSRTAATAFAFEHELV